MALSDVGYRAASAAANKPCGLHKLGILVPFTVRVPSDLVDVEVVSGEADPPKPPARDNLRDRRIPFHEIFLVVLLF